MQNTDGNYRFLGREGGLIHWGGEKFDPVEVEVLVAAHPKVRMAVVVGMPDERLGERIAAKLREEASAKPL